MPLASLPGLLRRALPVRWRRAPRRLPRHVLRVEPLEERALLATLAVAFSNVTDVTHASWPVWLQDLEQGRHDSITITLTSADYAGLQRLLGDVQQFALQFGFTPAVGWPAVSPASQPPSSPPPPPTSQVPQPGPELSAPPVEPPAAEKTLTPTLRGGLTLTLFRPPPTSTPARPVEPPRTADPAPEPAPDSARAAGEGASRPAAPPEWSSVGASGSGPTVARRPSDPVGPPPATGGRMVGLSASPPSPRGEVARPTAAAGDGPAGDLDWSDTRPHRPDSAGRGAPLIGVGVDSSGPTDDLLLRRYASGGDQPAFAELVRRHEAAVLRVSARVLGDADLARDAAQAAFLALARRAGELDGRGSLAGWLYRVAYRMALRARRAAARRWRAERIAVDRPLPEAVDPTAAADQADVLRVLHEELFRLPEKYRVPLVLCYLDGRSHEDVARAAGLPRGSVAKRIAEGLGRLRERLAFRGVVL